MTAEQSGAQPPKAKPRRTYRGAKRRARPAERSDAHLPRSVATRTSRRRRSRGATFAALAAVVLVSACSPSTAPLYRDFESVAIDSASSERATARATPITADLVERIRRAVTAAGWTLADAPAANVVSTEPQVVRRFGLYRTEVSIEVSPINTSYVRVFVHPYRVYFTGHRSKMPYLKRSIRKAVFPDLSVAFDAEGLVDVGNALQRDDVED